MSWTRSIERDNVGAPDGPIVRMVLERYGRAVQFMILTGDNGAKGDPKLGHLFPMAMDLGFHSPQPLYPGQPPMNDGEVCPIIDAPCYYGGSSFRAEPLLRVWREEGDDAVWRELERYWNETFAAEIS